MSSRPACRSGRAQTSAVGAPSLTPPLSPSCLTGSAFLNRIKDMKSRWSDMLNVDDLLAAELSDARLHPEIQWSASLRRSNDLCDEEAMLVKERRKRAAKQLQRFLRLPDEEEVDERDVPIVAIGGSGGGFRAVSDNDALAHAHC